MAYVGNLLNLAILYDDKREYNKAEPLYLEAKESLEKKNKSNDYPFAWLLMKIASLYENMNDFKQSEMYFLDAKVILEAVFGVNHLQYALCMGSMAGLYRVMGEYEKAEDLFLKAMEIQENSVGRTHPDFSSSLNGLAILYAETGQYEKAEPLYLESLSHYEQEFGKESERYTGTLNNLAILYWQIGDFEQSESKYLELIKLKEKIYGPESINTVEGIYNLALLYESMHNYKKAEELLLSATSIQSRVLGVQHSDYATGLVGLSGLYYILDREDEAEKLINEAKDIRERIFGKEHYLYTTCLDLLAKLSVEKKNYHEAELLYSESIEIEERVLGKDHPDLANTLTGYGDLCVENGDLEKAESLYNRANDIHQTKLGVEHPLRAEGQFDLAFLLERQARYEEAEKQILEASQLIRARVIKGATFLSEHELSEYVSSVQSKLDKISSLILSRQLAGIPTGNLAANHYDFILFLKGFLLTSVMRMNTLSATSPESMKIFQELKSYRRYLAKQLAKPLSEQQNVARFEEKANVLEKELSRSLAGYAQEERQVTWMDVQRKLGPEEVAIEFIDFRLSFPEKSDSIQYAALLLRPGADQPIFIPLCKESELNRLLTYSDGRRQEFVNRLYSLSDRGLILDTAPESGLYELLWKPLESYLDGVRTIYFASSGMVHQINLGAIQIAFDEMVDDKYFLIRQTSTRQLVSSVPKVEVSNRAVLFGGVRYEADSLAILAANNALFETGEYTNRSVQNWMSIGQEQVKESWGYLSFSAKEVTNVETLLKQAGVQTSLYADFTATEEVFKSLGATEGSSPGVLHVATHGYFYPNPDNQTVNRTAENDLAFKMSENPMIRSGLILAGANQAWQTGHAFRPEMEDGIVTAYEISQMNLSGTELVVLSACETGLGDIQGNEGVYGLQRAFKIAGAKYLIMSLWQVPDRQTSLLMATFYRKWLEDNMHIPDAFHAAQKELRDLGLNPHQWAGFVLVE